MHTIILYDKNRVGECGLNINIDLDPGQLLGQLNVDCISGWEGGYTRLFYGVYVRDISVFSHTGPGSYLSALNPRYAQQAFPMYIPATGTTPSVYVGLPNFSSPPSPPHSFPQAAVCRCDIKQLMGTGHSADCMDHPNNRQAGAGA